MNSRRNIDASVAATANANSGKYNLDYYYQEELAYMRDMGRVFSDAYPKLAPYLARPGSDPDVERLLEGFSFITSRIRRRMDDSLSEFAQDINLLMWPQLQRPIPSFSIAAFTPPVNNISTRKVINRGSEISSDSVQGSTCVFSTCYDVALFPLQVSNIEVFEGNGSSSIDISMNMIESASLDDIDLEYLRFYINGDTISSSKLYQTIISQLKGVSVRLQSDSGEGDALSSNLPPSAIRPVGFSKDTSILPHPDNSLEAHQQLLEYFCYPEKFLFFDVHIGDDISRKTIFDTLTISLKLKNRLEISGRLNQSNFLLYCTPIVNLFAMDAEPIRLNSKKLEYLVCPANSNRKNYQVYSVENVLAYSDTGRSSVQLSQLNTAHGNEICSAGISKDDEIYQLKIRPSVTDGVDNYISFRSKIHCSAEPSTVSIQLMCTNSSLPEKLKPGEINKTGEGIPAIVKVSNINIPTKAVSPQLDGDTQWQMLSNCSAGFLNLAEEVNVKQVLRSFHIPAKVDRQSARDLEMKLASIEKMECRPVVKLIYGTPVHGYNIIFDVRGDHYSNEGDLFLFFSVLHKYFTLLVDINTFSMMEVNDIDRGEQHIWNFDLALGYL